MTHVAPYPLRHGPAPPPRPGWALEEEFREEIDEDDPEDPADEEDEGSGVVRRAGFQGLGAPMRGGRCRSRRNAVVFAPLQRRAGECRGRRRGPFTDQQLEQER